MTQSTTPVDKVDVFDLIERMSALIRTEERKKCTALGLQAVHLQVLSYLSKCNKFSDNPAALTNYLGMTRGTVSQTLSLLEKKGFVEKVADAKDRRVVRLRLSEEGRTVLEKAKPAELFIKANALLQKKEDDLTECVKGLEQALTALQKVNNSQSYGICNTCHYFTQTEKGPLCGLFKQPLADNDIGKICQDHTVVLWWM